MARAIRARELKDMFTPAREILKTIHKDPETGRCTTVKPGDGLQSVWDFICSGGARATFSSNITGETKEGMSETYMYTEADELEDAVLFPEEGTGEEKDNLFREKLNMVDQFERKPMLDVRRFAADADTDEELSSDEGSASLASDDGDEAWDTESSDHSDEKGPAEPSWENNYEYTLGDPKDAEKAIDVLTKQFSLESLGGMAGSRGYSREPYRFDGDIAMFKWSWHMADLQPGARSRYLEWQLMVSKLDDYVMTKLTPGPFELCAFMQMADHLSEERRIVKDAFEAYAAIALFFESEAFLNSEHGQIFKEKMFSDVSIFDQAERAKHVPDRRTHLSNKTMPRKFWREFEQFLRDHGLSPGDPDIVEEVFPPDWRKAIRPVVVKLFRDGIITPSYTDNAAGMAVAAVEEGRDRDMYIDIRQGSSLEGIVSHLEDPRQFDRSYLLFQARGFNHDYPNARFAVLRVWSAPHFYPLMLGLERCPMTSFIDDRGRAWEFRFIPKDMPYSEWSIHQQLSLRIAPYEHIFGDQVILARDLFLVMGRDESDLRRLSEGVTWAVQTKPWRVEIDFWRSFVNVDVQFLQDLHEKWLE
ncbi:hypothetical protein K491DRAFT_756974 [Lophiostoma macrostomum CBS 122681]|uniref:Uncharacterized protein n=1 Tax=Lophiostoma macrostomum CBS 122681 TaxID=1314788 RepID=A0A6A6TBP0_9PLEO|nr:hypothetical protein K491DRAFT_756974 [Lophiostoma macrostomum CBS 122681]